MSGQPVERFASTGGRVMGGLALTIVAAIVVIGLVDREHGFSLPVVAGALVVGCLVWASMLRPRVWVTREHLVMRNMLHTVSIPLAAVEQVVVRQVLAVSAGEKRYVSPAIGRSWRQSLKSNRSSAKAEVAQSYPDFVEERVSRLAQEARDRAGVALLSDEQLALARGVRRVWAWPELAALVASAAFFVVAVAL